MSLCGVVKRQRLQSEGIFISVKGETGDSATVLSGVDCDNFAAFA